MKTKIYLLVILHCIGVGFSFSQTKKGIQASDTAFFSYAYWNGVADKLHLRPDERAELIAGQKKIFLDELSHQHVSNDELVWVSEAPQTGKGYGQNTTNAGPCTNIDFENGTMTGWTRSTGFNPITNTLGCCPTPNGDQTIMTGAGLDPYGGFPVVYPGGGSFSLRLGSTAIGGIADRISQTFFVTAANANFTYRYAVVLNDPNHTAVQQPRFTSEIIDTLGNPVICTTYSVIAGGSIPGFSTSPTNANGGAVRYKTWTDVAVDLSPNIGQNVTIRFSVYDCSPTGHFAYAYIDGVCTNFATSISDTTCNNVPVALCAPAGFSTTTWNGPGFTNDPNQCIIATIPGTYTCTTLLVPGCPGPTFTHTLNIHATAFLSFTPVVTGPCSNQYTFTNISNINSPYNIINYKWNFGDGSSTSSSLTSTPVHVYTNPGTYPVTWKVLSDRGCVDSVTNFITIFPTPNLAFSPPSNCINTVIQFTNTSTIAAGTISTYTWNFFGNGPNSNLVNPTNTYSANGTYSITLSATSSQGCPATLTQTLGIFPPPIISFTANPLCDINGTSFTPATSTAIASGSLTQFFWNFGDGGTSNLPTPVHSYTAAGVYTVSFTAISNHNCSASVSSSFSISPTPTVAFSTTSVNACSQNFTFTNNSAISSGVASYVWNFGGGNTTTVNNPTYVFPSIGNYTVTLIGTSGLGCADTAFHYISVYPLPVININVPASCENAIFTVSTTAVSGSVTSYNWNFGDPGSGAANTSTIQSPTHYYSTTNIYTLTLNIVSNLNCPSSSIITLTVFPNPVASFTYSTLNNCSLPYTFTNNSSVVNIGGSTLASYKWHFGGIITNSANPGTYAFPANGSYSVSLIATTNRNCSDTMSANIVIHPNPVVNFTVVPTCINVPTSFNSTFSISPVPLPSSSILTYTWNYGDNTFTNTAISPPHTYTTSGIYSVFFGGTSNMGCTASVTKTVEIYPAPTATFNTTSNLCFGNLTQFSSTNSVPSGTIFAHNWDFGDGGIGSNPITSHSYSVSGSYPVSFSVTTNHECTTILTKTVTIHPIPVASFTTNGGCLNTVSNFTQSSTVANTNTFSANTLTASVWNFGDGTPTSTLQNIAYTYTAASVPVPFTASLTVTSNNGCSHVATRTVMIHPLPAVAFSPTGACVGSIVQFTNNSNISLGSITSYTWDFADGGLNSNLISPPRTYNIEGPYSVTLTAVSNQSCVNTGVSSLNIYPYPQATVTPLNNSCINDQAKINTNISITAGTVPTHTLSFGDGAVITPTGSLTYTALHTYTAYNTYTITLNTISNQGCARTFTNSLIVYPKPFVNFLSSKFCKGDSTLFNNLSTIPPGYSITAQNWNFGYAGAPTRTQVSIGNIFPKDTVYAITLTAESYIDPSLTCIASSVKNVTINPRPFPLFTSNNACDGTPTSFSNITIPLTTQTVTNWSWFFYNNGQLQSVTQQPSFTYSTAGTYSAMLKAVNNFGCKDSVVNQVTIYANPTASFTANTACYSDPTLFLNSSTPGSGSSMTHSWNVGSTNFSTIKDPPYIFNAAGVFTVQLISTSDLGCKNTFLSTVTVNPLPFVNFSNNEACLSQATQFVNLSSGVVTGFTWNFGDIASGATNTSTAASPTHTFSNSGNYTATLQAISDKGCLNDTVRSVIVHANPTAGFTNTLICVGDNQGFINLSASSDGTLASHQWDFNGDNLVDLDAKNPVYTYSVFGNYVVKLKVTTQFGCTDTASRAVYANPKAVPSFSSNNRGGCPPLCVSFKDLTTIANNAPFVTTWDFGDGSPLNTFPNPTNCFEAGSYDISMTVVSDVGCTTRFKNPGYVSVFPLPVAGFKVEPDQVDEDEPIINVSPETSKDVDFIKYFINDGSSFGSPSFTHYFKSLKETKPMVVQIVKNKYGCSDTLFKVLEIKPAYTVYFPNAFTPNGDGTNDSFVPKGVGIIKFTMQIFDRWGHQVFKTNDFTNTWDGTDKSSDGTVKQDVYTWKAQVTDIFNKNHFMVGHVSVIR